jgi:hypothetical protein
MFMLRVSHDELAKGWPVGSSQQAGFVHPPCAVRLQHYRDCGMCRFFAAALVTPSHHSRNFM